MKPHLYRTSLFVSDAQAYVNPVNTVGVMGAGIALAFRRTYPEMFTQYQQACRTGQLQIGRLDIYRRTEKPYYIINLPTKKHWQDPSQLEYVRAGLEALVYFVNHEAITSIAIPALGCGLGGLQWDEVWPMITMAAIRMPSTRVEVFR